DDQLSRVREGCVVGEDGRVHVPVRADQGLVRGEREQLPGDRPLGRFRWEEKVVVGTGHQAPSGRSSRSETATGAPVSSERLPARPTSSDAAPSSSVAERPNGSGPETAPNSTSAMRTSAPPCPSRVYPGTSTWYGGRQNGCTLNR